MKVLMYGWEFPPNINGGLGVACYEIVHALLKKNIRIHLVLPQAASKRPATPEAPSPLTHASTHLNIQCVDSLLQPYMDLKKYNTILSNQPTEGTYGNDLIAEVKRYTRQAGALAAVVPHDIIHAHDWLTIGAGLLAQKISHKPLFFHVHSLEIDRSGEHPNPIIFDIEKQGLHQADKIFAVSHYTRNMIINHYHVAPDKITVAYNGIPASYHDKNPLETYVAQVKKNKIVLFLGRMTHQKGPFHFIKAAHKILSVRQDIQFVMAGDGDLLPSLIEYVAELNMGSHVHFLGFLDRKQVQSTYDKSSVYVMPSVSEPFGLSCLEALMLQIPVVISRQSGIAEVLHDVLKVDFWDTDAMAEKIIALIDYPLLCSETLKNSQHDLSLLNWDTEARHIVDTYHDHIGV